MALIKCSECGKEISDQAQKCPHCGKEFEKPSAAYELGKLFSKKSIIGWIIGIVVVIAIVGLVVYFATQVSSNRHSTDQTPSYVVEDESGLYRLQQINVHIDGNDFIGNDDGLSGFYAPEIYVRLYHNQDQILNTYDKAPQDKFDATFSPSVTIAWAKGDSLTVNVWDKDMMDDDLLFTVKIDHLRNGEFVTKSNKGSEITLTMSKIK